MKQAIGSFSHRNKFIKHRTTAIGQLTSQRIPQVCWRLQGGEELCTTNRREGPDTQSALANRHFGTSFCTILSNQSCRKVIDKADCTRMFQIGDRRVLIAYVGLLSDLLGKVPLGKGGVGVVGSTTAQIY